MQSAPARANSATWSPGRSIIRWTSSAPPASWTWSAIEAATSGPIVIGGTKWPSITSTWISRAPGGHHLGDLGAEPGEVGGEDRRRHPPSANSRREDPPGDWSVAASIRSTAAASSCRNAGRACPRRRSCGRSSGARRSSGTARRARSAAGSRRSGSGPAAGSGAATARRSRGTPGALQRRAPSEPPAIAQRLPPRRSRAMKKPSVRSRSGRVWRKRGSRREREPGMARAEVVGAQRPIACSERGDPPLVLAHGDRAGRVDERARRAPSAAAAAGQDRRLEPGQPLDQLGRLSPASVGARGERAEIGAGRIHEDAIVAPAEVGARGVRFDHANAARARAARRARAAGAPGPGRARPRRPRPRFAIRAAIAVVLMPGRGAEVEHPLARPRVEQRHHRLRGARLGDELAVLDPPPQRRRRARRGRPAPPAAPAGRRRAGSLDLALRRRRARRSIGSGRPAAR